MSSHGSRHQGIYFGANSGEEVKRADHQRRGAVVCPKPRRDVRLAGPEVVRLFNKFNISERAEASDWNDSSDLLENFRRKGAETNQIASSPPYFCCSPPCRTSNPLVHDERFGEEDPAAQILVPVAVSSKAASPMNALASSTSSCKGYAPVKSGFQPATMRIEGFDCLNGDGRGCGITAIA